LRASAPKARSKRSLSISEPRSFQVHPRRSANAPRPRSSGRRSRGNEMPSTLPSLAPSCGCSAFLIRCSVIPYIGCRRFAVSCPLAGRSAVFMLVGCLLVPALLLAAEGVLALLGADGPGSGSSGIDRLHQYSAVYGWEPRPGRYVDSGQVIPINRKGYRGPEALASPAPGRRRVVVLGDSVAFGLYAPKTLLQDRARRPREARRTPEARRARPGGALAARPFPPLPPARAWSLRAGACEAHLDGAPARLVQAAG
jgi:hypothetical protein